MVLAATLLQYWILKVLGASTCSTWRSRTWRCGESESEGIERRSRFGDGFWGTVVGVEVTDIAFSIDSDPRGGRHGRGCPLGSHGGIALFDIPGVNVTVDVKLLVIYIGGILGASSP